MNRDQSPSTYLTVLKEDLDKWIPIEADDDSERILCLKVAEGTGTGLVAVSSDAGINNLTIFDYYTDKVE